MWKKQFEQQILNKRMLINVNKTREQIEIGLDFV